MENKTWHIYIVKCLDGYLYTGITQNLKRRILQHNTDNKLGSKFVRVRRPVELIYNELAIDKGKALRRELEIKGWSRKKKLQLISDWGSSLPLSNEVAKGR